MLRFFPRVLRVAGVWWRGRRWRWLLHSLPALAAGSAVFAAATASLLTPVQELEARYLEQAKTALKSKDYAGAMACYDRLAGLGTDRPDVLYGLALSADGLGQIGRAETIMKALTPADQPGYAPAHLWLARHIMTSPAPGPGARDAVESHLLLALDGELEDPDAAHALLGDVYLSKGPGHYDQAEQHLAKAVKTHPQLRIRLAQLYALRGDKERAQVEGQLAVNYFRARAQADVHDRLARLGWADATAFLEDFPGAVAILKEGLSVADEPVYRTALGSVFLVWADAVGRDPKADPGDRLALIETGLRYDASNAALLNRLLVALKVGDAKADEARKELEAQLASGRAPASVHFALGLDAWQRGKTDEARLHLERAYQLAPQMPAVANNLAWVLATSEPADLPRALELSNFAVDKAPNDPSCRDTRGRVLMKLGRWKDALDDLEAALRCQQDDADLHKALAEVYERLGSPDMAAEHRRQADAPPRGKADPAP
jgi:tetratricopeptide (TPR) repeat protein